MKLTGKLVAFEGIDNAGKTSVIRLLQHRLESCRVPIVVCGELQSPVAPLLRRLLETGGSPLMKTYLFASDRAWTYEEVLIPALERGSLVLWDRYVDSAIAYRAVELSENPALIDLQFVRVINKPFVSPDLTIYVDIDVGTSIRRAKKAGMHPAYSLDFLEKVRAQYALLASEKHYKIVDGRSPVTEVVADIKHIIKTQFPELFI